MRSVQNILLFAFFSFSTFREAAAVEVLGIGVGKELSIPHCESLSKFATCYRRLSDPQNPEVAPINEHLNFLPDNAPEGIIGGQLYVYEGKVEVVLLFTKGIASQEEILALLREKFGTPSKISRKSTNNRMGAVFSIISAVWSSKGIEVEFKGAAGNLDSGIVVVGTNDGLRLSAAEEKTKQAKKPRL